MTYSVLNMAGTSLTNHQYQTSDVVDVHEDGAMRSGNGLCRESNVCSNGAMSGPAVQRTVSGGENGQPSMTVAEVVTANGRTRYVVVGDNGELVEPVARYLKYLDLCGKARNTLRTYARSLGFYFTFLGQKGLAYERVQIADLAGFVHWLKRTDRPRGAAFPRQIRSNRTINLHLGVVSGFYEYAWRTDQIDHDLNERLRGQMPGGYRPYKAFLHHLGTTPIQRNVLKQPTEHR
jgi:hypothetical protein